MKHRFEMDHHYVLLGSQLEALLIESADKLDEHKPINRNEMAYRIRALLSNAEDMTGEYAEKYGTGE